MVIHIEGLGFLENDTKKCYLNDFANFSHSNKFSNPSSELFTFEFVNFFKKTVERQKIYIYFIPPAMINLLIWDKKEIIISA